MENSLPNVSARPSGAASFLSRNWLRIFVIGFGIYVWLPFLAPVFMQVGWNGPGRAIYLIYSFLCHQLPQRSYFFFGPEVTPSLAEIQAAWQNTNNPLILRQFTGSPEMGWKVAWSDRMISLFGGLWLAGLFWRSLFAKLKRLHWWGFLLFTLPIFIDGASHFVSDLAGIGQGFRDSNLWLAALTNHAFSPAFYAGDALGSFNSWMRLITGLLFGIGAVWFGFPYLEESFREHPTTYPTKGS